MKKASRQTKSKPTKRNLKIALIVAIAIPLLGLLSWKFTPISTPDIFELNTSGSLTLALDPSTLTLAPNQSQTINLKFDSNGKAATAVSLEIIYDPIYLQLSNFQAGNFFGVTLAQPKIENGKLTATLAVSPQAGGKTGADTIATFSLKALKDGQTSLTFGESTMATSTDVTTNNLRAAAGLNLTIESSNNNTNNNNANSNTDNSNTDNDTNSNSVSDGDDDIYQNSSSNSNSGSINNLVTAPPIYVPEPMSQATDFAENNADQTYSDSESTDLLPISDTQSVQSTNISKPNLVTQVFLGWKIILQRILGLFS